MVTNTFIRILTTDVFILDHGTCNSADNVENSK